MLDPSPKSQIQRIRSLEMGVILYEYPDMQIVEVALNGGELTTNPSSQDRSRDEKTRWRAADKGGSNRGLSRQSKGI